MSRAYKNIVFLDRGNYTTCTINLHGGTILSYRVKNQELLHNKKNSTFNNFSPIRGSIKFTFPYYGYYNNGPRHGFARYVPWKLEEGPTTLKNGDVEAVVALEASEYTKAIWNYKFKLSYKLTLCMNELRIAVKVKNTSKYFPFRFALNRHSLWRVDDIRKVEIYGLSGIPYKDLYASGPRKIKQSDPDQEKKTIDRPTLHASVQPLTLFIGVPSVVEVRNICNNNGLKLRVKSLDPGCGDVLVYNPGEMLGPNPTDDQKYYQEDYVKLLGLGNGHLHSDIKLGPMETWEARHVIEVVDEEYDKRLEELGKLLDNPLKLFETTCTHTDVYTHQSK